MTRRNQITVVVGEASTRHMRAVPPVRSATRHAQHDENTVGLVAVRFARTRWPQEINPVDVRPHRHRKCEREKRCAVLFVLPEGGLVRVGRVREQLHLLRVRRV